MSKVKNQNDKSKSKALILTLHQRITTEARRKGVTEEIVLELKEYY
jgi:hypothetical protein